MTFTKRLREPIRRGEVTCSVRIWKRPHVKVGGRYPLPPGEIEVTRLVRDRPRRRHAGLARRGGFAGLVDLMNVAKHGRGERVFLVEFRYLEQAPNRPPPRGRVRALC